MALTPGLYFVFTTLIPVLLFPPLAVHSAVIVVSFYWRGLRPLGGSSGGVGVGNDGSGGGGVSGDDGNGGGGSGSIAATAALICTYTLALPAWHWLRARIRRARTARAAQRRGARVAPRADGVLPWNVDLLVDGCTVNRSRYLGDPLLAVFDLAGRGGRAVHKHIDQQGGDVGRGGRAETCSLEILGDDRLLTMNPENIKKVLATEFDNYRKGGLFNRITEGMLGVGVFNSDGEMWHFHRKSWVFFFFFCCVFG